MTRLILLVFLEFVFVFNCNSKRIPVEERAKIVENIYTRIFDANGKIDVAPRFYFDQSGESQVAYMSKIDGVPVIGFEGLAFDICSEFGERRDDAIAFIIGHEISHYTLKHHWGEEFKSSYSFSGIDNFINNDTLSITNEAAADERGAILCYLAGFNTRGLAKGLLIKIYEQYDFEDVIKGYPSLNERIQIAETKDSLVDTYAKVFEAGNYAMLMHDYTLAIDCYSFVEEKFETREVSNNLGVAYFKEATRGVTEVKYMYPIKTEDLGVKAKGFNIGEGTKEQFIQNALKHFKVAIGRDENYSTAYVNKACAYAVLEQFYLAKEAANHAIYISNLENSIENEMNSMNAELVLAIVYDADIMSSDLDKKNGSRILDMLIKKDHLLATLNKQIIDGSSIDEIDYSALSFMPVPLEYRARETKKFQKKEMLTIDEFNNKDYYYSDLIEIPNEKVHSINYRKKSSVFYADLSSTYVYIFPSEFQDGKRMVHVTKSNFEGQTGSGLKIGDSKDKALDIYGTPEAMIITKQGDILSFPTNQLFVLINSDLLVSKIIVYRDPIMH